MPIPFSPVLAEQDAWLRFAQEPGLSLPQALALLQHSGTPLHVYQQTAATLARLLPDALARQLCQAPGSEQAARLAAARHWLASKPQHRHLVPLHHPCYPEPLKHLADPPLALYVEGDIAALSMPAIAIVGARNATPAGKRNAEAFAREMAQAGWMIISGLARGIDAAAHNGALAGAAVGHPATLAVLGCGPDIIYPPSHTALAIRIASQGALVSDYPPGTPPLPHHFPRRNRLVAGLAQGTLVIEAALRSGSLVTARLAAESNREVFALPGSIHAPLSRGCHALIRQGAKLVETTADILEELPALPANTTPLPEPTPQATVLTTDTPSPAAYHLLRHLADAPTSIDALAAHSGILPAQLHVLLWELELADLIARVDGDAYQRIR